MDRPLAARRMKTLLGTFVEVGSIDANIDIQQFSTVFNAIEEVHNLLSFHDSNSDLSKLNSSNGEFVKLNRLSIKALRLAKAMARETDDRFNPAVGGELVKKGLLPDHHLKKDIIPVGRSSDIEIKGLNAKLMRPVLITLDGIAKGLAVDIAIEKMKALGFKTGWVNAGGDLRVFGDCKLPVQRRLSGSFENFGVIQNGAIASSQVSPKPSADFKSWIVLTEMKMSETKIYSVIAKSAWRADALTKVAAAEGGEAIVASLGAQMVISQ